MANHASAEKRDRQSKVRRLRNRMNKSRMHTAIRHIEDAVEAEANGEGNRPGDANHPENGK